MSFSPKGVTHMLSLLFYRVQKLQERSQAGHLSFDKDDLDALNFVTAATNLRCHIFSIPIQSRFDVKGTHHQPAYG